MERELGAENAEKSRKEVDCKIERVCEDEGKKPRNKSRSSDIYLIGAPLDWAGFSRMVMVVSVSLRAVSDSYSGIMGAEIKHFQQ